jgi:hypothetical protein
MDYLISNLNNNPDITWESYLLIAWSNMLVLIQHIKLLLESNLLPSGSAILQTWKFKK